MIISCETDLLHYMYIVRRFIYMYLLCGDVNLWARPGYPLSPCTLISHKQWLFQSNLKLYNITFTNIYIFINTGDDFVILYRWVQTSTSDATTNLIIYVNRKPVIIRLPKIIRLQPHPHSLLILRSLEGKPDRWKQWWHPKKISDKIMALL